MKKNVLLLAILYGLFFFLTLRTIALLLATRIPFLIGFGLPSAIDIELFLTVALKAHVLCSPVSYLLACSPSCTICFRSSLSQQSTLNSNGDITPINILTRTYSYCCTRTCPSRVGSGVTIAYFLGISQLMSSLSPFSLVQRT